MDSLVGILFNKWWFLLKENRFNISSPYWSNAIKLTLISINNQQVWKKEEQLFGASIAKAKIEAPIFVFGHWRSGTTLLHNLLSVDNRFAAPTLLQVTHPSTFLLREKQYEEMAKEAEKQKRPMDNIQVSAESPGEDEFAISTLSARSPLIGWTFPKRETFYDRFLTFMDASEQDVVRWKKAMDYFYRKLTYRYDRPLLLESPTHTARLRLLYEIYPDAKFIHIHRNPYEVIRSTLNLYEKAVRYSHLQVVEKQQQIDNVFRRYKLMYDAYFKDREAISVDRFIDISFEELETDMVGQIEKIYQRINIDGFGEVEPKLVEYIESISSYQKNKYDPLPKELKTKVRETCKRSFVEWEYSF